MPIADNKLCVCMGGGVETIARRGVVVVQQVVVMGVCAHTRTLCSNSLLLVWRGEAVGEVMHELQGVGCVLQGATPKCV